MQPRSIGLRLFLPAKPICDHSNGFRLVSLELVGEVQPPGLFEQAQGSPVSQVHDDGLCPLLASERLFTSNHVAQRPRDPSRG